MPATEVDGATRVRWSRRKYVDRSPIRTCTCTPVSVVVPPDAVTASFSTRCEGGSIVARERGDRPGDAQRLGKAGGREGLRRPGVVRVCATGAVVAVAHGHEIRLADGRVPGRLLGGGDPTRARREERGRDRALVPDDPVRGIGHRGRRGRRLMLDRAVHLAARVGERIEVGGRVAGGNGIGASGDGLALERRQRPRRRHLARHDPAQVLLEADDIHALDARSGLDHPERAVPVLADKADPGRVVQAQRLRARVDLHRGDERLGEATGGLVHELQVAARPTRLEPVGALRQGFRVAGGVLERHPRRGAEVHGRARRQQHPLVHRAGKRRDVGAGEVVIEDLDVAPAVLGIAERPVLRHADAVPPAVPGERELRRPLS